MEIAVYFTAYEEAVSITVHASPARNNYSAVTPFSELPPPPAGYVDTPFTRAIFHAFSLQEKSKWK